MSSRVGSIGDGGGLSCVLSLPPSSAYDILVMSRSFDEVVLMYPEGHIVLEDPVGFSIEAIEPPALSHIKVANEIDELLGAEDRRYMVQIKVAHNQKRRRRGQRNKPPWLQR